MSSKRTSPAPSALQRIGVFVLFLFGVEVAVLLAFGGPWPATRRGWILLLVLGPPVYLLSEWLLDRVFARVEKLDSEPKGRLFSWRRVLVALIVFLVLIALVGLVLWLAGVDLASFPFPRAAQHVELAAVGSPALTIEGCQGGWHAAGDIVRADTCSNRVPLREAPWVARGSAPGPLAGVPRDSR